MSNGWSNRISNQAAYRRAGGRRRVNTIKQERTRCRQLKLMQLIMERKVNPLIGYGRITNLARALGVCRQTVYRDFNAILLPWRPQSFARATDIKWWYEFWWHCYGQNSTWFQEVWFGRWWDLVKDRNSKCARWKSLGDNCYVFAQVKSRSLYKRLLLSEMHSRKS